MPTALIVEFTHLEAKFATEANRQFLIVLFNIVNDVVSSGSGTASMPILGGYKLASDGWLRWQRRCVRAMMSASSNTDLKSQPATTYRRSLALKR